MKTFGKNMERMAVITDEVSKIEFQILPDGRWLGMISIGANDELGNKVMHLVTGVSFIEVMTGLAGFAETFATRPKETHNETNT